MKTQPELQEMLEELLNSPNAYFQPPASVEMQYPAIEYSISDITNTYADNSIYQQYTAYELIVIDQDPNSELVRKVSRLPMCKFVRHYVADNLNHAVFILAF